MKQNYAPTSCLYQVMKYYKHAAAYKMQMKVSQSTLIAFKWLFWNNCWYILLVKTVASEDGNSWSGFKPSSKYLNPECICLLELLFYSILFSFYDWLDTKDLRCFCSADPPTTKAIILFFVLCYIL